MRNIHAEECSFVGTDIGTCVKSAIGRRGLVRDVLIRSVSISDLADEAILFNTDYENTAAGQTATVAAAPGVKGPEVHHFSI